MSDSQAFSNTFLKAIATIINDLEVLRILNDRISEDSALAGRSAASAQASGRSDLTATDFNNAVSAITQLLFTFNSGSPTQKSFLYKML